MSAEVNQERKLLRTLIKRVHPDLFSNNDIARVQNSESLKVRAAT